MHFYKNHPKKTHYFTKIFIKNSLKHQKISNLMYLIDSSYNFTSENDIWKKNWKRLWDLYHIVKKFAISRYFLDIFGISVLTFKIFCMWIHDDQPIFIFFPGKDIFNEQTFHTIFSFCKFIFTYYIFFLELWIQSTVFPFIKERDTVVRENSQTRCMKRPENLPPPLPL